MGTEDELDPTLAHAVRVMRHAPARPLSGNFTDRVVSAALTHLEPDRVDPLRRLFDYLFRPRLVILRPAWGLAFAVVLLAWSTLGSGWRLGGPGADRNVLVRFAVRAPGARSVSLAGDFNAWATEDIRLEDPEGDGVWHAVVPLNPGVYQYMFVLNGDEWIPDPFSADSIDDGFGQKNSLVRVDHLGKEGRQTRAL